MKAQCKRVSRATLRVRAQLAVKEAEANELNEPQQCNTRGESVSEECIQHDNNFYQVKFEKWTEGCLTGTASTV